MPSIKPTPSTLDILGLDASDATKNGFSSNGGGGGGGPASRVPSTGATSAAAATGGGGSGGKPPQKLGGLKLQRSGATDLLGDMNLNFGGGEANGDGMSDSGSMETLDTTAGGSGAASPRVTKVAATSSDASAAQAEADRHVQIITAAEAPYHIVWASEAWLSLCEFTNGQVLGQTLEDIQGRLTDRAALASLMGAIKAGTALQFQMVNTLPSGKTFSHAVRVEPLRDSDGRVQCFQATSSNIVQMNDSGVGARAGAACPPAGSASASRQLSTGAMQMASGERGNSSGFKRTSSDLKISEMLDLFEKHEQNGASPMVTSSTNQKSPSHLALDTLPEGRESIDGVAGGGRRGRRLRAVGGGKGDDGGGRPRRAARRPARRAAGRPVGGGEGVPARDVGGEGGGGGAVGGAAELAGGHAPRRRLGQGVAGRRHRSPRERRGRMRKRSNRREGGGGAPPPGDKGREGGVESRGNTECVRHLDVG